MSTADDATPVNPYESPQHVDFEVLSTPVETPSEMRWVRRGLEIEFYTVCVLLLLATIKAVVIVFLPPTLLAASVGRTYLLIRFATLSLFVAPWFCIKLPVETKSRELLIFVISGRSGAMVFAVMELTRSLANPSRFYFLDAICTYLSFAFFALVLKRISTYLQSERLIAQSNRVVISGSILLVIGAAFYAASWAMAREHDESLMWLLDAIFLPLMSLTVVVVFLYAKLLGGIIKALSSDTIERA